MSTDLYQIVTDQIVEALEAVDKKGWVCPWSRQATLPRNGLTGRQYNGLNVLILWAEKQKHSYSTHEWFTYNQAKKAGGNVKEGASHTKIVYWNFLEKPLDSEDVTLDEFKKMSDEEKEDVKTKTVPICRYHCMFNRDQCEGLPSPEVEKINPDERDEKIDAWIESTGVSVRQGAIAAYSPKDDEIQMPPVEIFRSSDAFYSTFFHELTHWTGAESRLDRKLGNRFGSEEYAMEELVAELGSAFLCADFQVEGDTQHPEYLQHWLDVLKEDKYAIFTVSRKAQDAAKLLHELAEGEEDTPDEKAA